MMSVQGKKYFDENQKQDTLKRLMTVKLLHGLG